MYTHAWRKTALVESRLGKRGASEWSLRRKQRRLLWEQIESFRDQSGWVNISDKDSEYFVSVRAFYTVGHETITYIEVIYSS